MIYKHFVQIHKKKTIYSVDAINLLIFQDLSKRIRDDPRGSHFSEMPLEDALKFLETDEGDAARAFRTLRSKHAHRCYKEIDVYSKTWDIDPRPLVKTLQENVRSIDSNEKTEDTRLTIDDLENRPSFVQKYVHVYS